MYASEELQKDRLIVLEAVKQAACALRYASKELRADRQIVLEAVKQDRRCSGGLSAPRSQRYSCECECEF